MKAIIFDVDNTLIKWDGDAYTSIRMALDRMQYPYDEKLVKEVYDAIDENETIKNKLDKEDLTNFINNKCHLNLSLEFINNYIITSSEQIKLEEDIEPTIKYLSEKYDLYVISNWFTETQERRLERVGVLKYFKKVYGADINYFRPDPRTFDVILKDYDKKDLLYIGDNLEKDVKFPLSMGIDAIWKTDEESNQYKTIKRISELQKIL